MDRTMWAGKSLLVAAGSAAVLINLSACTKSGTGGPDTIANDTGEKVTVRLLREPVDVPAFTVTDIEGKTTSSSEWRGKVVLVNFWATWCAPCRAEIPDLIALQEKYRDKIVILGLSEDEDGIELVKRYAAEHKINYPVAMSTPEIRKLFPEVMALPTTFVLDRDGKMAQKNIGMLNRRETEAGARILAGLSANAEVVKVELNEKPVGLENAAAVKEIPGIDLSSVPAAKRTEVLLALNEEGCTCGCGLTVAKCRIDDPSCPVSLPKAKEIVARIAGAGTQN